MDLRRRISERNGEFLLFAVTPPRQSTSPERAQEIADATLDRLRPLALDGLVLYDIDDESDRNTEQRPFPFLSTMDPADYLTRHLTAWTAPTVVFRVVGKYPEPDLRAWLDAQDPDRVLSVFVGASTREKEVAMSLKHAHELRAQARPTLALGGDATPERHTRKATSTCGCSRNRTPDDVLRHPGRLRRERGKNIVSDVPYAQRAARDVDPVPIVLTFTVVGSTKTLGS